METQPLNLNTDPNDAEIVMEDPSAVPGARSGDIIDAEIVDEAVYAPEPSMSPAVLPPLAEIRSIPGTGGEVKEPVRPTADPRLLGGIAAGGLFGTASRAAAPKTRQPESTEDFERRMARLNAVMSLNAQVTMGQLRDKLNGGTGNSSATEFLNGAVKAYEEDSDPSRVDDYLVLKKNIPTVKQRLKENFQERGIDKEVTDQDVLEDYRRRSARYEEKVALHAKDPNRYQKPEPNRVTERYQMLENLVAAEGGRIPFLL